MNKHNNIGEYQYQCILTLNFKEDVYTGLKSKNNKRVEEINKIIIDHFLNIFDAYEDHHLKIEIDWINAKCIEVSGAYGQPDIDCPEHLMVKIINFKRNKNGE